MTRSFKRTAFRLTRAVVQSILVAVALVIAYRVLRIVFAIGSAIADACQAKLFIPLIMLVAGSGICLLAGHLLGDESRTDQYQSKNTGKD